MCIRWLRCSRRTGSWKGGRLRGSCCCCRLRDARLGEDSSRAAAAQEGPGRQSGVLRWKATESRREATCVRTHRPVPSLRDSRLQLAYPALTCRAFLFRRFAAAGYHLGSRLATGYQLTFSLSCGNTSSGRRAGFAGSGRRGLRHRPSSLAGLLLPRSGTSNLLRRLPAGLRELWRKIQRSEGAGLTLPSALFRWAGASLPSDEGGCALTAREGRRFFLPDRQLRLLCRE